MSKKHKKGNKKINKPSYFLLFFLFSFSFYLNLMYVFLIHFTCSYLCIGIKRCSNTQHYAPRLKVEICNRPTIQYRIHYTHTTYTIYISREWTILFSSKWDLFQFLLREIFLLFLGTWILFFYLIKDL